MPRKRPGSPAPRSAGPRQLSLLDLIAADGLNDDRRETLVGMLNANPSTSWRGMQIVPPGTLLEEVASLFQRTTDFPLEVPVFLTLHALAAYLLDNDIRLEVAGTKVRPDLWTTILAPSGSGKTLSTSAIAQVMPLRLFPEATTAARFIEELAQHNRAAWFQDEWAQVLKRIDSQSYAEELRDYLLRLYDNKPIARRTVKATIEVEDPALVVVGTTVQETFLENVSAESMLDGFMQRFQFVIGDADADRPASAFPIYRLMEPDNLAPLHAAWTVLAATPLQPVYYTTSDAESAFTAGFREHFNRHRDMPASFFRRVMWRTFKYALVYHWLLGKETCAVDAEDVRWALRVAALHLTDARRLLNSYDLNELEVLVRKAEDLRAKLGRPLKPRDLIAGVRGIRNAATARFILQVMNPAANDNDAVGTDGER